MNSIELTKQLISIPSFLDEENNEVKVGEFIFNYLKQFKFLKVEKQMVANRRFNVIAKDKYPTSFLWCGHIDTVPLQNAWTTNPLLPTNKNDKLYGLGSSDMKSGIAAILSALSQNGETKGLMMLFYVDEEYDFLGTKKFAKKYKNKIQPKIIMSGDGKNLAIGRACRGIIELRVVVRGVTGHASQPQKGINAITRSVASVNKFENILKTKYSSKSLQSVCNLAYLQGGMDKRVRNLKEVIVGRQSNVIPDIAELMLDIRTASEKLNSKTAIALLSSLLRNEGLKVETVETRFDLGAWITDEKDLIKIKQIIENETPTKYLNPQDYGFIDLQILWQTFGRVPSFTFGPGSSGHQADEYVELTKLKTSEKVYKRILRDYVGKK